MPRKGALAVVFAVQCALRIEELDHRQNLKARPPGKFGVLANALRDTRRGGHWGAPERSVLLYDAPLRPRTPHRSAAKTTRFVTPEGVKPKPEIARRVWRLRYRP
jgi:hypothetical protein